MHDEWESQKKLTLFLCTCHRLACSHMTTQLRGMLGNVVQVERGYNCRLPCLFLTQLYNPFLQLFFINQVISNMMPSPSQSYGKLSAPCLKHSRDGWDNAHFLQRLTAWVSGPTVPLCSHLSLQCRPALQSLGMWCHPCMKIPTPSITLYLLWVQLRCPLSKGAFPDHGS